MRKYYVTRNRVESMIGLIGKVVELTALKDDLDEETAEEISEHVVARLKEILLEEIEEE